MEFNFKNMIKTIEKSLYISLSIFLGFLLSIIFHSLLEIFIISQSSSPEPSGFIGHSCYLPSYLNIGIALFGLIGGFYLGKYWYKKVYEKE